MFGKKKINDPTNEWTKTGSFVHKPDRGWLHSEESLRDGGVCYAVKYVGCVKIEKSMRTLPYEMRQQVTREAILQCCEAAGYRLSKRKKPSKNVAKILGDAPNMAYSGTNVNLTLSATGIKLVAIDTGRRVGNHDMQGISFASGGEKDCIDMVGYVAKDEINGRACHVCDCGGGLAFDVINTIGQAFEIRFKMFLQNPPQAMEVPGKFSETSIFEDPGEPQYNEISEYCEPTAQHGLSRENRIPSGYQVPAPVHGGAGGAYARLRTTATVEGAEGMYDSAEEYRGEHPPKLPPGGGYDVPKTSRTGHAPGTLPPLMDESQRESLAFAAGAMYENPGNSPTDAGIGFYKNPLAGSATGPRLPSRMDSLPRNLLDEPIPDHGGVTNGTSWATFEEPAPPPPPMSTHPEFAGKPPPPPVASKPPPKPIPYAQAKAEKEKAEISMKDVRRNLPSEPSTTPRDFLQEKDWFHGSISRREAEVLLEDEGDFLVRESKSQPGQYVLSGIKSSQPRHLLLVDPQGQVRTKDKVFENVDQLISYHLMHKVPIISAGSEVTISNPVIRG